MSDLKNFWKYRHKLTINSGQVGGDLSDYVVYVGVGGLHDDILFGANPAQSDGGDIRASLDSDGNIPLPLEIWNFTPGTAKTNSYAEIYVKLPLVTSATDTDFYLWWGHEEGAISQPAVTDPLGRNAVWSDYELVLHLGDTESYGWRTRRVVDATGNITDLARGCSVYYTDTKLNTSDGNYFAKRGHNIYNNNWHGWPSGAAALDLASRMSNFNCRIEVFHDNSPGYVYAGTSYFRTIETGNDPTKKPAGVGFSAPNTSNPRYGVEWAQINLETGDIEHEGQPFSSANTNTGTFYHVIELGQGPSNFYQNGSTYPLTPLQAGRLLSWDNAGADYVPVIGVSYPGDYTYWGTNPSQARQTYGEVRMSNRIVGEHHAHATYESYVNHTTFITPSESAEIGDSSSSSSSVDNELDTSSSSTLSDVSDLTSAVSDSSLSSDSTQSTDSSSSTVNLSTSSETSVSSLSSSPGVFDSLVGSFRFNDPGVLAPDFTWPAFHHAKTTPGTTERYIVTGDDVKVLRPYRIKGPAGDWASLAFREESTGFPVSPGTSQNFCQRNENFAIGAWIFIDDEPHPNPGNSVNIGRFGYVWNQNSPAYRISLECEFSLQSDNTYFVRPELYFWPKIRDENWWATSQSNLPFKRGQWNHVIMAMDFSTQSWELFINFQSLASGTAARIPTLAELYAKFNLSMPMGVFAMENYDGYTAKRHPIQDVFGFAELYDQEKVDRLADHYGYDPTEEDVNSTSSESTSFDPMDGMLRYWEMNQGVELPALPDSSPNGESLSVLLDNGDIGSVKAGWWISAGPHGPQDKLLAITTFDGTKPILRGDATGLPTGNAPLSLSFWAHGPAVAGDAYLYIEWGDPTDWESGLFSVRLKQRGLVLYDSDYTEITLWDASTAQMQGWHYYAITWNGDRFNVYVDFVLVNSFKRPALFTAVTPYFYVFDPRVKTDNKSGISRIAIHDRPIGIDEQYYLAGFEHPGISSSSTDSTESSFSSLSSLTSDTESSLSTVTESTDTASSVSHVTSSTSTQDLLETASSTSSSVSDLSTLSTDTSSTSSADFTTSSSSSSISSTSKSSQSPSSNSPSSFIHTTSSTSSLSSVSDQSHVSVSTLTTDSSSTSHNTTSESSSSSTSHNTTSESSSSSTSHNTTSESTSSSSSNTSSSSSHSSLSESSFTSLSSFSTIANTDTSDTSVSSNAPPPISDVEYDPPTCYYDEGCTYYDYSTIDTCGCVRFTVTENTVLQNVRVDWDLDVDSYPSEVRIYIESPSGTRIELPRSWFQGNNVGGVDLSDFNGETPDGQWEIDVRDTYGDSGVVDNDWKVTFTLPVTPALPSETNSSLSDRSSGSWSSSSFTDSSDSSYNTTSQSDSTASDLSDSSISETSSSETTLSDSSDSTLSESTDSSNSSSSNTSSSTSTYYYVLDSTTSSRSSDSTSSTDTASTVSSTSSSSSIDVPGSESSQTPLTSSTTSMTSLSTINDTESSASSLSDSTDSSVSSSSTLSTDSSDVTDSSVSSITGTSSSSTDSTDSTDSSGSSLSSTTAPLALDSSSSSSSSSSGDLAVDSTSSSSSWGGAEISLLDADGFRVAAREHATEIYYHNNRWGHFIRCSAPMDAAPAESHSLRFRSTVEKTFNQPVFVSYAPGSAGYVNAPVVDTLYTSPIVAKTYPLGYIAPGETVYVQIAADGIPLFVEGGTADFIFELVANSFDVSSDTTEVTSSQSTDSSDRSLSSVTESTVSDNISSTSSYEENLSTNSSRTTASTDSTIPSETSTSSFGYSSSSSFSSRSSFSITETGSSLSSLSDLSDSSLSHLSVTQSEQSDSSESSISSLSSLSGVSDPSSTSDLSTATSTSSTQSWSSGSTLSSHSDSSWSTDSSSSSPSDVSTSSTESSESSDTSETSSQSESSSSSSSGDFVAGPVADKGQWQPGPDWLNANEWTAYPFVEMAPSSTYVIDAQVSVIDKYSGQRVTVTRLIPGQLGHRSLEMRAAGDVIIAATDQVRVRMYGMYEIWDVFGKDASATLVVNPLATTDLIDDPAGWELAANVIQYQTSDLITSIDDGEVEVAGPGEGAMMYAGSHISFDPRVTDEGFTWVISAIQRSEGPCVPPEIEKHATNVQTVNGLKPNSRGELIMRCGDCFSVSVGGRQALTEIEIIDSCTGNLETKPVGPSFEVEFRNICKACCDCADYARLFEFITTTHLRLVQINKWSSSNRELYIQIVQYVKSLLDMQIIGEREATCDRVEEQ